MAHLRHTQGRRSPPLIANAYFTYGCAHADLLNPVELLALLLDRQANVAAIVRVAAREVDLERLTRTQWS